MDVTDRLDAVRSDRIEFITMRHPGSPYATLDRRVVVTGPPPLVELSRSGDPGLLDALVDLLDTPDRAWAAEVLLAALTRREEKLVESFATVPDEWWQSFGATTQARWRSWLDATRDRLTWDAEGQHFVEQPGESPSPIDAD
jgi:hypothetical protein